MDNERLKLIEEMLADNPEDPFLNYAAALEYRKIGNLERATGLMENLLVHHADYVPTYYQLGKIYETTARTEKAIETYKLGLKKAKEQNDFKTSSELSEAIFMLED